MTTELNEIERRVLGALMEKSMANPEYYPMTENALVAACNQKQNRDPVMELDGEAVWSALESLRERGLVSMVLPAPGARTKRFKHEVEAHFGWPKRERAIMAELLLRGPQTTGELRTRCSRFAPFDDLEAVTLVLENLAQREPPMVATLPREPGRSAVRYAHRLYPADESPTAQAGGTLATAVLSGAPSIAEGSAPAVQPGAARAGGGADEIAALRAEVAELRARLERLEQRHPQ
ncbi:MAG: YceH family protein [Phycisphaerales bacterium]|nr:YceH family protein [Phycisphaerales bacterium]